MLHHNEAIVLSDITTEPPGFLFVCKDVICAHEVDEFLLLVMIETTDIMGERFELIFQFTVQLLLTYMHLLSAFKPSFCKLSNF